MRVGRGAATATALAGATVSLALIAASAVAYPTRAPLAPPAGFDVPSLVESSRDTLVGPALPRPARATASAVARRYPVKDGRGRRVSIGVSTACKPVTCNSDNPGRVARFLGTLPHGAEISRLRVALVTDDEIGFACGGGALACYFVGRNLMYISGNDTPRGGVTREFVLAHEYGHHVAEHRDNRPFAPTIDWGTKRWATHQRICQATRRGFLFPGDQGAAYYRNPGEAFAESFAFNRFPGARVRWAWPSALRPDRRSFAAIRRDTIRPWTHRVRSRFEGALSGRGPQRFLASLRTPLDGVLSLRLRAARGGDFDLVLRDRRGRFLEASLGPGARESLDFVVCGQARLRAVVVRRAGAGAFRLSVLRP